MENILSKAIQSVQQSEIAFCKFLAANDTKATKAHQAGYLVSKSAWEMFLKNEPKKGENIKVDITIKWQDDFETDSIFTYYGASKNEFRLTKFERKFPYREEDNVGDLFVLAKKGEKYFEAYILESSDDIEDFFSAFNISSNDTNGIIPKQFELTSESRLISCFEAYLSSLTVDFPSTFDLAGNSRNCYNNAYGITPKIIQSNLDKELLKWIDSEFQLFKTIENDRYQKRIEKPFQTVEELIKTANTILQRRKSRAGKSLELHLAEIFRVSQLNFSAQAVTEDKKKPDFLFPTEEQYHNPKFDHNKLIMLASKTTCKDRWRQILNEADRIKTKHLFTLQQGISSNQLDEMYKHNVCLVVPQPYLKSFPENFKDKILTLDSFIRFAKANQG